MLKQRGLRKIRIGLDARVAVVPVLIYFTLLLTLPLLFCKIHFKFLECGLWNAVFCCGWSTIQLCFGYLHNKVNVCLLQILPCWHVYCRVLSCSILTWQLSGTCAVRCCNPADWTCPGSCTSQQYYCLASQNVLMHLLIASGWSEDYC